MKHKKTIERAQIILDKFMSLKEKNAPNPYWIEGTDDEDWEINDIVIHDCDAKKEGKYLGRKKGAKNK